MKRKVLAIFCACLLTFSLAACGNNTSAVSDNDSSTQVAVVEKPSPEVTATVEPAEEEKPSVTVTEKPEEEKPDDVVEPTEEPTQDDTSTDTDEAKPDSTSQDAVTSTTDGTSTDTTSQDTTPTTTDQQPAQETTPTQTDPVADTGSSFSTAGIGNSFDVNNYAYHVSNADVVYEIDHQVMIVYGSWFIEMSTNNYNASNAYISVGRWDQNATYWNVNTYSYVFAFGEGSRIIDEDSPGYSYSVSKTALAILPTLVDYMKASGDPSVAPNIPGCTFKPCQSDNPFTQY